MSLYDVLMGRQQQLASANNSLAEMALARADKVNAYKDKALADLEDNKKSIIGEFSQGGILDTAVATLASPVTQTGNALAGALEMFNDANETDPIKAAQTRLAAKKIRDALNMDSLVGINPDTGERTSSLHRRVLGNAAVAAAQGSAAALQGLVGLASIPTLGGAGALAEELGFRPKEGIDLLEKFLTPEMQAVNKNISATTGFGATAEEILSNPSSIPHNIIKSLPSMLAGGAIGKTLGLVKGISTGVAGSLGEGAIMAGSAAEGIREDTADRRLTLKQALLATGIGAMGAGVGFAGNKLAKTLGVADIDEALVQGALNKSALGTTSRTLITGGIEGGEELVQSTGETIGQNVALDKPYDQGVGNAAALGLFTGAPMGAMAGLGSGAELSSKAEAQAKVDYATAVENNDPSVYSDPESQQYSPSTAVNVLLEHANLATATEDVKKLNVDQANAIIATAEDGVTAAIAAYEQGVTDSDPILTRKSKAAEVTKRIGELNEARGKQELLNNLVRGKVDAAAVVSDLEQAKAVVDPQDKAAVQASQDATDRLINLSMVSPEHFDEATATELATNTSNGLNEGQRDYLRQFSMARAQQNALETPDTVGNTILNGDKRGNRGLNQYNNVIGQALSSGDKQTALRYLTDLANFALDHSQKAIIGAATLARSRKEDQTLQMVRGPEVGSWETVPKARWIDDLMYMRLNGGFAVHPNSKSSAAVIERMPAEAEAINQTLLAHATGFKLKFGELPQGITLPAVATPATQAVSVGAAVAPTAAGVVGATQISTPPTPPVAQTTATPASVAPAGLVTPPVLPSIQPTGVASVTQTPEAQQSQSQEASSIPTSGSPTVAVTPVTPQAEVATSGSEDIFTETARLDEIADTEQKIKQATKVLKRLNRGRNSMSLWSALKHSMTPKDVSEVYRSEAKRYSLLKAKKGTNGSDLSTRVSNGDLDAFLPAGFRKIDIESGRVTDKEAVEKIVEKLRNSQYLTEDTLLEIRIIGETIDRLEKQLSLLDIKQEIEYAEAEITQDNQTNNSEAQEDTSQTSTGDTATPAGEEAASATEPVAPKTEGVLTLFSQYVKNPFIDKDGKKLTASEVFTSKLFNPVAQFLKQTGVKAGNLSNKPFVAVKDFIASLNDDAMNAAEFVGLKEGETLSPQEVKAIKNLMGALKVWRPSIKENLTALTKINPDYKHKDLMQSLYQKDENGDFVTKDGKPVLDENIVDAIGLGAYNWIVSTTQNSESLTNSEVNKLLGRGKEARINPAAFSTLRHMSAYESNAVEDMGKSIAQALGFTNRDGNTPADILGRLENALGTHAMQLLIREGYVQTETVTDHVLNYYYGEPVVKITHPDKKKPPVKVTVYDGEVVSNAEGSYLVDAEGNTTSYTRRSLVQLDRNGAKEVAITSIKEANKGTKDILGRLFGVEKASKAASETAVETLPAHPKNSKQDIPEVLQDVARTTQAIPHTPVKAMFTIASRLGKEAMLKIGGFVTIDEKVHHKDNQSSYLSQNDNLTNQYDRMMGLVGEQLEKAHYVTQSIWKNYRASFTDQDMNLQTSKFHRYMFSRPSWTVTLDLNDSAKTQALMDEFLISFAMALGIKTDKTVNAATLAEHFYKDEDSGAYIYANDTVMDAAVAMYESEVENRELTGKELDSIVAATAKGEIGALQALTAYVAYLKAAHYNNDASFEYTMLVGADGKTNGPMLTLLALGAADFEILGMGGFYNQDDDAPKHFSEYASTGGQDLYQRTGRKTLDNNAQRIATELVVKQDANELATAERDLRRAPDEKTRKKLSWVVTEKLAKHSFTSEQLTAFQGLVGKLEENLTSVTGAMRDLIKTPITAYFFGSGLSSAVLGMENNFIANFANNIEALAKDAKEKNYLPGETQTADKLAAILNANNLLMRELGGNIKGLTYFNPNMSLADALQTSLTNQQERALRKAFKILLGNATEATLKTEFAAFATRRDGVNKTIQASFVIFETAYEEAKDRLIYQLIREGKMPSHVIGGKGPDAGKHEILRALTPREEKSLQDQIYALLPQLHTAYSKAEGNLDAGIFAAKSKQRQSKSTAYQSNVAVGNKKHEATASELVYESPGIAGLSYTIHSADSFIMHMALLFAKEALNVHDEISTSSAEIKNTAAEINKQVVNMALTYSPAAAAAGMFERLVIAFAAKAEQGLVSPTAAMAVLTQWTDIINRGVPRENRVSIEHITGSMAELAYHTAWDADIGRNGLVENMSVVDQYTWEGGQHLVTNKERATAAAQKNEAQKLRQADNPPPALAAALQILIAHSKKKDPNYFERMDRIEVEEDLDSDVEVATGDADADTSYGSDKYASWGPRLAQPRDVHEEDIVALFDTNDVINAKDTVKFLLAKFAANNQGLNQFYHELLSQVGKVIPSGLTIQMIRPTTATIDVMNSENGRTGTSKGWYSVQSGREAIYIMSPDFVHSAVTAEILVHELLHASLSAVLYDVRNGKGTVAANEMVKDLTRLLDAAKEKATELGLEGKFSAIFEANSPIDELVSWGMSNKPFQDFLSTVLLPNKVQKTGLQAFLDALTKFFFRTKDAINQYSGMATLLGNVAGLFEEASKLAPQERSESFSMATQINAMSTLEVHDALDTGQVSPKFNAHLKSLLTSVVDALHGPFGTFKDAVAKGVASTPADVFNEAMSTGVAPFTSDLQASGFKFNNQTFYVAEQVEATIKTLLDAKDSKMSAAREELRKLEAEVRGKLKPQDFHKGDWFQATKDERDDATALHDYLFKKVDGDYLARFAALGLAHEEFNTLLNMPTKTVPAVMKDRSVSGALTRMFNKVLETVNGKLTHTKPGQAANDKLAALVRELVQIENRNKNTLKSPIAGMLHFADQKAKAARSTTKSTVSKVLNSSMFMNSKIKTVAAASSLVNVVASNQVKVLITNVQNLSNKARQAKQNVATSFISEMNGHTKPIQKLLREGKAFLEGARKNIISDTNKTVLAGFYQGGKYLTDAHKESVTAVLLRTGAHVLLNSFDMKGLAALVTDSAVLNQEIANYEAKLSNFTPELKSRLILDSKALGYFLITNRSKIADMKMNAHNIAHLYMTEYFDKVSDTQKADTTAIIDELVSLYALSYARSADRNTLAEVLTTENARTDGNGVELALLSQRHFEQESLSRIFSNNPVQMSKGYIPEVYNQHTDIQAATQAEGEHLLDLGYKRVARLSLDPNDPYREQRTLYVLRNGGMLPWLSGMFSLTSMRSKGTKHHGEKAVGTQNVLARNAGTGKVVAGQGEAFNPEDSSVDYMVPTLNPDGVAVNYRYMMRTTTKDNLMERDSRFDQVLGKLAGSIFDKEESAKHNENAVKVLYDDFQANFTKRNITFLKVGPKSPDPELREIYQMLPQATKDAIRATWGKDEMLVRPENLDISFGYRKLSISNRFSKDVADQTAVDKAMIYLVSAVMRSYGRTFKHMNAAQATRFGKSHAVAVRRIEEVIQEIVYEAKDIFVVKNLVTSLNNIKSNMITLALYGVSPIKGLRDMRIAWVAAEEHQRDRSALAKLQLELDSGYTKGDTSAVKLEIQRLTEALKNNPISELIEAGLMPTIVEDVSTEEDPYAYKTLFAQRMKKYTDKVNPTIRTVARNAYMAHDTGIYRGLSRVVQLSDFVARYAMYQHLITKETDPMTKEEAQQEAAEAFISYDTPMHRELEYMDSVGAFMFTKYFLRVQRVIRGRIKNAPGKLALMLIAESFLGDLPTILDSSVVVRTGHNPLQAGPFELLQAIPELPIVKLFRW